MATLRSKQVDVAVTRWYHCISRCARELFLMERKPEQAWDRREWLHRRVEKLATVFAIEVGSFSILDNHLHLLAYIDVERGRGWEDAEVVRRWGELCPPRDSKRKVVEVTEEWVRKMLQDPEWVAERRRRLLSLSWFHKFLKEEFARLVNAEDDCCGPVFNPRFKAIGVLDEESLLSTAVYIDLNPFAAGIGGTPEAYPHTSLSDRLGQLVPGLKWEDFRAALQGMAGQRLELAELEQGQWLCPLDDRRESGGARVGLLAGLTLPKYVLLVDYTARLRREGKAVLGGEVASILERLGATAEEWGEGQQRLRERFTSRRLRGRYLGATSEALEVAARRLGVKRLLTYRTELSSAVAAAGG